MTESGTGQRDICACAGHYKCPSYPLSHQRDGDQDSLMKGGKKYEGKGKGVTYGNRQVHRPGHHSIEDIV